MTIKAQLETFLISDENEFVIGPRSEAWINSFKTDLDRWKLPVALNIGPIRSKKRDVRIIKSKEENEK